MFQARTAHTSLFSANWDFQKMGIGGLDEQFVHILRRAFASRVFPPDVIDQLGVKHVRGLLLYGPPGWLKSFYFISIFLNAFQLIISTFFIIFTSVVAF